MKRLIPAAIIAIGLHSLLMIMDLDWMKVTDLKKPSIGTVTITLESIQSASIHPKSESRDSKRFIPKPEPKVVKKPLNPVVHQKPAETVKTKRVPKKRPLRKPALPPPKQTSNPKPQPMPDGSSQGSDASLPAPRQEAGAIGAGPMASVSSPPATLPTIEEALPEYGKNPPIFYPISARRKGYIGTVILEVLVNRTGKVKDLRILASSGYAILDRSAVKSVRAWSFKPAKKGNDAVEMWVQVPVQFKLE